MEKSKIQIKSNHNQIKKKSSKGKKGNNVIQTTPLTTLLLSNDKPFPTVFDLLVTYHWNRSWYYEFMCCSDGRQTDKSDRER